MLLPRNRPANVLLVDDDEDVLESYCHLLRLSGYQPSWSPISTCPP